MGLLDKLLGRTKKAAGGVAVAWLLAHRELERERSSAAEKTALLEQGKADLETFRALSAQALQQNSESFLALARHELGPIRESVEKVQQKAEALEQARQR